MLRLLPVLITALVTTPLAAQCGSTWLPGQSTSGPGGTISAVLTLPNGDVIAGGTFATADAALANNVARWDGTAWRSLGSGASATVSCLARLPNGDIVAGGGFTTMGGVACNRVARWNGASWSPLGTGFDSTVNALLVLPNGDLLATGTFVSAGATVVNSVARWNGIAWSALGSGLAFGSGYALAHRPNGEIYVGGDFYGTGTRGLMMWNGTAWQIVPGFDPFSATSVYDLAVLANGSLVLSGVLSINNTPETLAVWNGTTMQPLTATVAYSERALLRLANGDLLLGGTATAAQPSSLMRWNGSTWTPVAGAPTSIRALAEDASGNIIAGTNAAGAQPRPSPVLRFDGVQWQRLGAPVPPLVQAAIAMPNGDVVVGGVFTSFQGIAANRLARWNGVAWAPLGAGVDGSVRSMALAPNGDLIVSGTFQNAGGAAASCIARWNGVAWATLGAGLPAEAVALAVTPNGTIYASAPTLGLREFTGGTWSTIATGGLTSPMSLAVLANGTLALGGVFSNPAASPIITGLALYSGGVATVVSGAPIGIGRMLVTDAGLVTASGFGVRRWDGTTWTTLLGSACQVLGQLPNGDLLAGGAAIAMAGSSTPSALYRFTAGTWVNVGGVLGGSANCIAVSGRGEIFAGGQFTTVAGAASYGFTQTVPTCPAAAQVVGSGCSGGAGPVTLAARSLPWTGGTFRADATGMTNNSLALQLVGQQPASGPLPGGAPGCALFVNALFTDALLPANGVAAAAFQVPNQTSLAGLTFRLQVVGIELGPTGIVRLTSTNALAATVGAL